MTPKGLGAAVRPAKIAVLCLLLSAPAVQAAEMPAATQVLKETGIGAGLAVVVGTTDGALEAELTNDGKMLVQGLALSDEAAAKVRRHLFERKLYGLASVSRVESANALPYQDRLVNLLVADLDALGRDAPSSEEIARVLGYEGAAYLKKGGRWARTVKPTPGDVDSWGHYHYDASGNPVSKDLVVGPPNTFRWVDGPFAMNLIGGFRTCDGVAVQINGAYLNVGKGRPQVPADLQGLRLWARDVNSGVLLWHRPVLPADARLPYAGTYTETFVAAGGRVYIYDFTDGDKVALTALNLRSGAVERVFDQGVVCRKAEAPAAPADSRGRMTDWRQWASDTFAWSMVLVHEGNVVQMVRDKIFVMDAATGNVLWKKQTGDGTHYLKVLITGGRLVALVARTGPGVRQGGWATRSGDLVAAEAWQGKDGTPLWRTDLSGLAYPTGAHEVLFHQNFGAQEPYLLMPHEKGLRLMSAKDGSLIWDQPVGTMIGYHIIKDRIWLGHGGTPVFGGVLMLATGEKDPTPRSGGTNQSACDAPTATLNWFMGKRNFVPVERKPDWPQWVAMRCFGKKCGERAACSYGSVYGVSPMCGCDQFIRGSGACYAMPPATPVKDEQRLMQGGAAALGAVTPQEEAHKSVAASFWGKPEGLESLWFTTNFRWSTQIHHWPGYGLRQTAPVQAGDLTLVAHVHEHRLTALREGKEVWNVVAGGRIGAPPVVYRDLAIFASHDGYVYAVKAKDGTPAWRFLAAPADRLGMESDLEPYRQRKNYYGQRGEVPGVLSDGRAQMNDLLELREGKLWLHGVPLVDATAPKGDIMYPRTIIPPQLRQ
jgi:hypothetical protein